MRLTKSVKSSSSDAFINEYHLFSIFIDLNLILCRAFFYLDYFYQGFLFSGSQEVKNDFTRIAVHDELELFIGPRRYRYAYAYSISRTIITDH